MSRLNGLSALCLSQCSCLRTGAESCDEEGLLDESGAEEKPSPESSTLKPFLWISCDGIRPKLYFLWKNSMLLIL